MSDQYQWWRTNWSYLRASLVTMKWLTGEEINLLSKEGYMHWARACVPLFFLLHDEDRLAQHVHSRSDP